MSDNPFSKIPDRARIQVNAIPVIKLRPLPKIPESHLRKFPELRELASMQDEWVRDANSVLTKLSSALKLDSRLDDIDSRLTKLENS